MGIYTAYLDVAMAPGSPTLGWIADESGVSTVFVVSAGITFRTVAVASSCSARHPGAQFFPDAG